MSVPADESSRALGGVVRRNRRRAHWLCAAPALAVVALAVAAGAASGALVVGVVAGCVVGAGVAAALWRGASRLVLSALGARRAPDDEVPGPATQVEGLCATMGLPLPSLYLVDDPLPDALSVGRSPEHGAVVLTSGLMEALDPVAVEAVLAHELAHLKRHDTAPATVGAALALLSGLGSGAGGDVVHRLAGRGREFEADRHAVGVTRYPPALSKALGTMSAATVGATAGGSLSRRGALVTRWLFTVALPDGSGGVPDTGDATGELDAPSVRIAALDEW